jgi:hypothetical protein
MAPHIALHEIGAPFESRPISFKQRQTRAPEFNPEGKVPTLLIDGRALTEVVQRTVIPAKAGIHKASQGSWAGMDPGFRRGDGSEPIRLFLGGP